jgi:hypothetical protein
VQEEHGGNCGQGRKNLWAPWRVEYIQSLSESGDCFICRDLETPEDDDKNLVLWRSSKSIVILNRFPYNNGHLLIAPQRHIGDLGQASDEELLELMKLMRESQKVLSMAIKPHGFSRDEFRPMRRRRAAGAPPRPRRSAMGRGHEFYERMQ